MEPQHLGYLFFATGCQMLTDRIKYGGIRWYLQYLFCFVSACFSIQ